MPLGSPIATNRISVGDASRRPPRDRGISGGRTPHSPATRRIPALPAVQAAYQRLLHDADAGNVAVMCGEPTWWRCHRRIIADPTTRDGHRMQHIMPNGSLAPHHPSDWLTRDLDQAADK